LRLCLRNPHMEERATFENACGYHKNFHTMSQLSSRE
jgi:hypothetical protein